MTRRGWIGAILVGAGVLAVGVIAYLDGKSSAAVTPTPQPKKPIWSQLTGVQNGSAYLVTLPANATFAFSDNNADPALPSLIAAMQQQAQGGLLGSLQQFTAGTPPPTDYPADGLGNAGYRVTGVNASPGTLDMQVGAVGSPYPPATVWVISGFTNA